MPEGSGRPTVVWDFGAQIRLSTGTHPKRRSRSCSSPPGGARWGGARSQGLSQAGDTLVVIDQFFEPGLGKDVEIEDLVPPRLFFHALKDVLTNAHPSEKWPSQLPIDQCVSATKRKPTVDVANEQLAAIAGSVSESYLDKTAVLDRVFDLLDADECTPKDRELIEKRMLAVTSVLRDRINDNLRQRRHCEVRRTTLHVTREFRHLHPVEASKAQAMELLERLRELGNRVAPPGEHDRCIDAILARFNLRRGVKSDAIADYARFRQEVQELHKNLTVDPALQLL